jgi:hypothetical protein
MLSDCKDYFQHHSHLTSCFNDLKPIVCRLPVEELKSFATFVLDWTSGLFGESENSVCNFPDSIICSWFFF